MEFRQLRYFCMIAEEKKFTTAAKQLFIAQPALSQSIAQLEKELGTPLFLRMPKGVELTDAGELFYQYATKALRDRENILHNLASLSSESGSVSICVKTVPDTSTQLLLDFQARYPNISVNIIEEKSNSPDFIISNCIDYPEQYDYTPLKTDSFYCILPATHPLAKQETVSILDLAAETIVLESNLEFNEMFLNYCRANGFYPRNIKVCPIYTQIPRMVCAYQGYAALFQDGLVNLPPTVVVKRFAENLSRTVWLNTRKSDYPPAAVNLLRTYIQEHFLPLDQRLRSLNEQGIYTN